MRDITNGRDEKEHLFLVTNEFGPKEHRERGP
jgi:hypothetical protein